MCVMRSVCVFLISIFSLFGVRCVFGEVREWSFDGVSAEGVLAEWEPANGSWEVSDGIYRQRDRWGEAQ